jgi:hypothetical protein
VNATGINGVQETGRAEKYRKKGRKGRKKERAKEGEKRATTLGKARDVYMKRSVNQGSRFPLLSSEIHTVRERMSCEE